jgi:hypothetical protein
MSQSTDLKKVALADSKRYSQAHTPAMFELPTTFANSFNFHKLTPPALEIPKTTLIISTQLQRVLTILQQSFSQPIFCI